MRTQASLDDNFYKVEESLLEIFINFYGEILFLDIYDEFSWYCGYNCCVDEIRHKKKFAIDASIWQTENIVVSIPDVKSFRLTEIWRLT